MKPPNRQALKRDSVLEQESKLQAALKCVKEGQWPNLKVQEFKGRGRGLVATRPFSTGSFVCHYSGTLHKGRQAHSLMKEAYKACKSSYMYECPYQGAYNMIDASTEDESQGRLINHGLHGNVQPTPMVIQGHFYLFFRAKRHIEEGEEILYDYGQRAARNNDVFPWLNTCPCRICMPQEEIEE